MMLLKRLNEWSLLDTLDFGLFLNFDVNNNIIKSSSNKKIYVNFADWSGAGSIGWGGGFIIC